MNNWITNISTSFEINVDSSMHCSSSMMRYNKVKSQASGQQKNIHMPIYYQSNKTMDKRKQHFYDDLHNSIFSKLRYWQTKGSVLGYPPSFQIPFTPESEYQLVIRLFSAPKLLLGSFLFQKVFSSFHCCPSVQPHSPSANLKPPIHAGFPAFPPAAVLS